MKFFCTCSLPPQSQLRVDVINLSSKSPPFSKGGAGGISWESLKIPLNLPAIAVGASIVAAQRAWRWQAGPPLTKGDFKATVLELMILGCGLYLDKEKGFVTA